MNLEDIMLSEIRPSRKTNTAWFHLYEGSKVVKLMETESRTVVATHWGEGEKSCSIV